MDIGVFNTSEINKLTWRRNADGTWMMCRTYPVSADEEGHELYAYLRSRPENLVQETGFYFDKLGQKVATGTVILNRVGRAVAWRVG